MQDDIDQTVRLNEYKKYREACFTCLEWFHLFLAMTTKNYALRKSQCAAQGDVSLVKYVIRVIINRLQAHLSRLLDRTNHMFGIKIALDLLGLRVWFLD